MGASHDGTKSVGEDQQRDEDGGGSGRTGRGNLVGAGGGEGGPNRKCSGGRDSEGSDRSRSGPFRSMTVRTNQEKGRLTCMGLRGMRVEEDVRL